MFEVTTKDLIILIKHKNGYNTTNLTIIVLKFGVAVAKSYYKHKLQASTYHARILKLCLLKLTLSVSKKIMNYWINFKKVPRKYCNH